MRQFLLLALLWGLIAWGTAAFWAMTSGETEFAVAIEHYYAVRAPLVGSLAGMAWAPLLCWGYIPGRASQLAGRAVGLAVESRTRHLFRVVQGAVVGQLVGLTMTIALLFIWPNDMQNDRSDAFKWAFVFWKLYWWIFVPAGAVAGMLSVAVARRMNVPRRFVDFIDR